MAVTLSGFPRLVEVAVIPGAAAGTTFLVPGNIKAGDTLLSVRHVSANLVTNADITANGSIPADTEGRVTVATTNSTGNFLVITWAKAAGS
jgi:hypothetical protein